DAAETRIGDQRDFLAPGDIFERGGQLVGLLHARTHGATARDHDHIAGADLLVALPLDGRNGRAFAGKDTCGALFAIDAIGVNHAAVDRGALDHRTLWRKIAAREGDSAGQAAFACTR